MKRPKQIRLRIDIVTTLVEVVIRVGMRRPALIAVVLLVVLSGCNAFGPQQSSNSTSTPSTPETPSAAEIQSQTVAAMNATETYHINVNQTIRVSRTTKRAVNFTGEKQMTNHTKYYVINTSANSVINRQVREAHTNITRSFPGRETTLNEYILNKTLYQRSPSYTRLYGSPWIKVNITGWKSQVWHQYNTLTRQRKVLNMSDVALNGTETVNGVKTYQLKAHPNINQVEDIVFNPVRKGNIVLTNITATYWVNKETMRPMRTTYQLSGTLVIGGREFDIESRMDFRISRYNEPVTIELPSEADTAVPISGNTLKYEYGNKNMSTNRMDKPLVADTLRSKNIHVPVHQRSMYSNK
jgi:outer membrane lipoprotein-sorting protein